MGDGLRLTNENLRRSTSSLSRYSLEGTHSERKLSFRPESDDRFALAEARCLNLQEKLDQVKMLKRKRNSKKRSLTRVNEQPIAETAVPTITVRTQPKKKTLLSPIARMHRLEGSNPARAYVDPATVEQHRMLGHMRTLGHDYRQPPQEDDDFRQLESEPSKQRLMNQRRTPACPDGGDGFIAGQNRSAKLSGPRQTLGECEKDTYEGDQKGPYVISRSGSTKTTGSKRKNSSFHSSKEVGRSVEEIVPTEPPLIRKHYMDSLRRGRQQNSVVSPTGHYRPHTRTSDAASVLANRRRHPPSKNQQQMKEEPVQQQDKPVVELFKPTPRQALGFASQCVRTKPARLHNVYQNAETPLQDSYAPMIDSKQDWQPSRRPKYRKRRYEKPTVASQMKQAGIRYFNGNTNYTNIPFVASISTAPSHNIGVNIQQVLNGLKKQQPLSGIPLTIAHHMGLCHMPNCGSKFSNGCAPMDDREINVIKLGQRLLRLPTYKYMSYNRLLDLYREGDGMVPRFLRAISRPHYFYTSMYKYSPTHIPISKSVDDSLSTNQEVDFDAATSKGRGGQEAKQSLAEYTNLYHEYELVEKFLKENYQPELAKRKEELAKELSLREEQIRKVVQDINGPVKCESARRASVSNTEDSCFKHSTFKLNVDD